MCHPSGAKKGFINGEALTLIITNSSIKTFEENLTAFKKHLMEGGYPQNFINNTLPEVKFQQRTQVLPQRNKPKNESCPSSHNTTQQFQISGKSYEEVVPKTEKTIAK